MNFNHIKQKLIDNSNNTLEIYDILKNSTGAKNIDIFYCDKNSNLLFDKISQLTLKIKYLGDDSIIGNVYLKKVASFIQDVTKDISYNIALDNPFKLNIINSIIIPIFNKEELKGIIRLSMLPTAFSYIDFINLIKQEEAFKSIFENNQKQQLTCSQDLMEKRRRNYIIIQELKKLYNMLYDNKANSEFIRIVDNGRKNLNDIFTYLNPSLNKSTIIKENINKLNINKIEKLKLNVIISDDVNINVQILKSMLSTYSNVDNICCAFDGIETILLIKKLNGKNKNINVIFLDHHMPGALGTDIARDIKHKTYHDEDIIIVSITNDLSILEENRELYDYHVPKPFSKSSVDNIIKKICLSKE